MTPHWLAGYFEARGQVVCTAREVVRNGNRVRGDLFGVVVCGTPDLCNSLAARYGGKATTYKSDTRWRASAAAAAGFLRAILPHTIMRRDEIEAALLFHATQTGRGSAAVTGDTVRRREALARAVAAARPKRRQYAEGRARAREMRALVG